MTQVPAAQKTNSHIEDLKSAVLNRLPVFKEILEECGKNTLFEFVQKYREFNTHPVLRERRAELVLAVKELLQERLGDEVAIGVARQMEILPLVSTAEHHGFFQHPLWVNTNIVHSIPYFQNPSPDIRYLLAFSFAGTSLNNSSCYARGLMFYGGENDKRQLYKVPIFPDRKKMCPVYSTQAFRRTELKKAYRALATLELSGVAKEQVERLRILTSEFFYQEAVMQLPDLNSQITKINYHIWQRLFVRPEKDKKIPELIYLEIETIVARLLERQHLFNQKSLLYKLLFERTYQPLIKKIFNGIRGGFSIEENWGTYLFWGLNQKHHRVRLALKNNNLVAVDDNTFSLKFDPETIADALLEKRIYPSMLLCYITIALYYGVTCLGGFCQVNDLTKTKEAWTQLLESVGEKAEVEIVKNTPTKKLGGDGMALAYTLGKGGKPTPAGAWDKLLEGAERPLAAYVEMSKKVTLEEIIEPMLPEIYKVVCSAAERLPRVVTPNGSY